MRQSVLVVALMLVGTGDLVWMNMSLVPRVLREREPAAASAAVAYAQVGAPVSGSERQVGDSKPRTVVSTPTPRGEIRRADARGAGQTSVGVSRSVVATPSNDASVSGESASGPRATRLEPSAAAQPVHDSSATAGSTLPAVELGRRPPVRFLRTGGTALDSAAKWRLRRLAQALRRQPQLRVVLHGHTDQRGPAAANRELGRRRAHAVSKLLTRWGVEPSRIEVVGVGSAQPMDPEMTPRAWALNRRVEITVTEEP